MPVTEEQGGYFDCNKAARNRNDVNFIWVAVEMNENKRRIQDLIDLGLGMKQDGYYGSDELSNFFVPNLYIVCYTKIQWDRLMIQLREAKKRKTDDDLSILAVFACRYAHHRKTGAARAVIGEISKNWDKIDEHSQKQIVKESNEATYNKDDWAKFRGDKDES